MCIPFSQWKLTDAENMLRLYQQWGWTFPPQYQEALTRLRAEERAARTTPTKTPQPVAA